MDQPQPPPSRSSILLDRIPNGFIVLLGVAFLLQGPIGALRALGDYTKSLGMALLGGEGLFAEVICQTAPLTLAAVLLTIALRSGWLTLDSFGGWLVVSIVLIASTWLGGTLRTKISSHHVVLHQETPAETVSVPDATDEKNGTTLIRAPIQSIAISDVEVGVDKPGSVVPTPTSLSLEEALPKLIDFSPVTADSTVHRWGDPIPMVAALPIPKGVLAIPAKAINLLLGYIVAYGPRLFLASILVGVYLGWTWQPLVTRFTA